jgi:oligopeptidase B
MFIRGGGDGNDVWADLGRLDGKKREFDDVEACVKSLQRVTGCKAANTVLFGRSAGGLIVGNLAARWPNGELAGTIYAEVPYVDFLKTAANPKQALTAYEYKEFGNPAENPRDLKTIRELSPVDALPADGAPGIFVVARTSLNDREVLPNETVKWIRRLRGSPGDEKYLSLTGGHGHFVGGATGNRQKAEDFLLLNGWLNAYKKSPV